MTLETLAVKIYILTSYTYVQRKKELLKNIFKRFKYIIVDFLSYYIHDWQMELSERL